MEKQDLQVWENDGRVPQFYNYLNPRVKSKKKPIYESRKIVLNQAQD